MVLVTNITLAMICCIYCCICWGSWANTQKLVQKQEWKSFLFYWDYIAGLFLTALLGLLLFNGGHLFDNLSWNAVLWPLLGGLIWNLCNIFLTASIGVAGMSVGFPIGGGLGWVGGIIFNYFSSGFTGNKALLWVGVVLAVLAMILCGVSYSKLAGKQQKSPKAGIIFAIISGFGFAFFYGLVVKGTAPTFGGVGSLSPYQAVFFFALAVLVSTLFLNPVAMKHSVEGKSTMKDYFSKGDARTHLIGMLGGFIWMSGMVISFMTAQAPVNKAVSYALSNASPLVAMIWGVLIWKEFKEAPKGTMKFVYAMFLCFLAALVLIAASN
ncbi:MAG: multidrug DMT transporter permease [Bacteroidales bacterium]|nr:multidrug DMT transporter permease [Bacteroidales bacterium]